MAAWISLFELMQVKRGERLLVLGVAGSVGSIAVQLAKAEGIYVYGYDYPVKAAHAQKIGVDRFITTEDGLKMSSKMSMRCSIWSVES